MQPAVYNSVVYKLVYVHTYFTHKVVHSSHHRTVIVDAASKQQQGSRTLWKFSVNLDSGIDLSDKVSSAYITHCTCNNERNDKSVNFKHSHNYLS